MRTGPPPAAAPERGGRAELGRLARGGLFGLLGAGISAGAGVLVVIVLARGVPLAVAGTFFAATSVLLLGQVVAKLGTNTSLVYYLTRFRAQGHPQRIPGTLRVALGPVVALSLALGVTLWLAAPALAPVLIGSGSTAGDEAGSADGVAALRACAVLLPVAALADTLVSATRGFDTLAPTVLGDRIGRSVLQVLAVAVAVLLGWTGVAALVTAWALPFLLPAVLGAVVLARRTRRYRSRPAAAPGSPLPGQPEAAGAPFGGVPAGEFWRFTGPRAVAGIAQLALQRLDIVLVAALLGPGPAAVYTAASRVLVVGQLANQAISTAVQARLGELLAVGDTTAANETYRAATAWLVLLNWPVYLVAAVFAPQLLAVFGVGYGEGLAVVLVLAAAMLLAAACGMVNLVLVMAGRTTWNLGNALLALAVNVVLDLLLIPSLGLVGAAIGWAAAIAVSNLVALAQLRRAYGLHPFGRGTLLAMPLAAGCFGVLPAVGLAMGGPLLAGAGVLLGAIGYVVGLVRWRRPLAVDVLRAGRRAGPSPAGRPEPVAAGTTGVGSR